MTDRRILRTRGALQRALLRLLQKKQLSDIQVKDLVKEADISRPTFYLHYSNIEDLLVDMLSTMFAEFLAALELKLTEKETTSTDVMGLPFSYLDNYRKALRNLIDPRIEGLLLQQFVEYIRQVNNTVRKLKNRSADPETALKSDEFMAGGIFMIAKHYILEDQPDWREYAELTLKLGSSAQQLGQSWF